MSRVKLSGPAQSFSSNYLTESSVQEHDLGALAYGPNGTTFRYVKCGATAVVPGKLYDGPASVTNHMNIAVAAAAAIGATSVTVTLGATAATANQYAGGYLIVNDVTGEGYTYAIKSHPAADASASLVVTLEEDDPLKVALTTSSEVSLVLNQFNGITIHVASTETGMPVGVGRYAITATYYGWIQTGGPVACLHDASPAEIGEPVAASTTTDGCVTEGTGALAPIGVALTQGVSTEYNPIYMTMY